MARLEAGNQPGEFGGLPGLYGDIDPAEVLKQTKAEGTPYEGVGEIQPHQTRMALTQTDPADPEALPRYGDGGTRVA